MTLIETQPESRSGPAAVVEAPPTPAVPPAVVKRRKALLRFAISISVLNLVGHLVLGFEQAPIVPIACILVSYVANLAFEALDARMRGVTPGYAGGRTELFYFLLPAHIAALACAMLLYADNLGPYLFAVIVAAASKYVFRVRVRGSLRHFLNPSNLGISATLLTMPLVGFAPPYMFLNNVDEPFDWLIPVGVLMAGTLLNAKLTNKMPMILGWVGGYVLQAILRDVFLGDSFVATVGMMTGVAFVLYTNYMITDPGTTPTDPRRQVVFGLSIAAGYAILVVSGVSYAIFFSLIAVCCIRGALLWASARR